MHRVLVNPHARDGLNDATSIDQKDCRVVRYSRERRSGKLMFLKGYGAATGRSALRRETVALPSLGADLPEEAVAVAEPHGGLAMRRA